MAAASVHTPHCDHLVQVYRESVELADAAATFLAAGFEAREPAVAIATAAHWPLIAERLARRGWRLEELEAERHLYIRDAHLTLKAISDEHGPSARKFHDVVGTLLRDAGRRSPQRRVRAFGEMVDVLVRRGDRAGADILERYWNQLATQRHFTLLCGYRVEPFDTESHNELLPQVYRSPAQVLPTFKEERIAAAVERALVAVLGEADTRKVYEQVGRSRLNAPTSQLALMWVGAHMPRAAEQVVAAARSDYAKAPAA